MAEGTQRRLAAIVSADVVGYSRLMGVDETGTLASLGVPLKQAQGKKRKEVSGPQHYYQRPFRPVATQAVAA
jgi:hypothetical protein